VDEFLSDDEQAERTKQWVRDNAVFIVMGIVIGLGSLFGWEQWKVSQQAESAEASVIWAQLQSAVEGQRFNEVGEALELLEQDFAATPYLDQARFAVARMYMDRSDPEAAIEQLETLAATTGDDQLRRIAEFRTVQILLYLQRYDAALALLGPADTDTFAGHYHELRGDILFAQDKPEEARTEYQAALDAEGSTIDRAYVRMKFDDASGSVQAESAGGENEANAPEVIAEPAS